MTPERIMAWAIPAFFVLIAVEFAVARWRGHRAYRSNDAINSLGLGVISQIVGVFTKLLSVGAYAWCAQHLALRRLPADSAWVWISALLVYDFLYYWCTAWGTR
jgi:sterol desaturase/sphingolipid hydroxylase (fatty acid hydroxylase superfamily)